MQASETKLRQLIEGQKQYVVPLFQRQYSWSVKQWKTLWADIRDQLKHPDGRQHSSGSIVTTPAKSLPQGVGKYLLADLADRRFRVFPPHVPVGFRQEQPVRQLARPRAPNLSRVHAGVVAESLAGRTVCPSKFPRL